MDRITNDSLTDGQKTDWPDHCQTKLRERERERDRGAWRQTDSERDSKKEGGESRTDCERQREGGWREQDGQ